MAVHKVIPVTQLGMVVLLIGFWALFQVQPTAAAIGFYFFGMIYGALVISQFWTLANETYDPRQAKRLFGFIGGGASLGGAIGAGYTALLAETLGTNNMLLSSAAVLVVCALLVIAIVRRESPRGSRAKPRRPRRGWGDARPFGCSPARDRCS